MDLDPFRPNLPPQSEAAQNYSFWKESWARLKCNGAAMFGFYALCILLFMAIVGPYISPYTYYETHLHLKNLSPSSEFWFGTDELGRDLFTRVWWGARISLLVGIVASLIDPLLDPLLARRYPSHGCHRLWNHHNYHSFDHDGLDQYGANRSRSNPSDSGIGLCEGIPMPWSLPISRSLSPSHP